MGYGLVMQFLALWGNSGTTGIYNYIQEVKVKDRVYRYLRKVVYDNGECREINLGNIEEVEKIITEYRRGNPKSYNKYCRIRGMEPGLGVADPGGFEPPTTGLGGRRSVLAELRVHPR